MLQELCFIIVDRCGDFGTLSACYMVMLVGGNVSVSMTYRMKFNYVKSISDS